MAPVTPLAPGDRVQTTWHGSALRGLVGVVVELQGARVLVDYGEHGEVLMFASELARVTAP